MSKHHSDYYSGLQVVNHSDLQVVNHSDLQVVNDSNPPEVVPPGHTYYGAPNASPKPEINGKSAYLSGDRPSNPSKRMCGLSKKMFWVIGALVLILIIGAAVGGAVGGTQAARAKANSDASSQTTSVGGNGNTSSKPNSQSSSQSSTMTPSRTTTPSATLSTTTIVGPTQTLYRDCPSSNNTIYMALGSPEQQFRKICNAAFRWVKTEAVNKKASSLNECVNLCAAYNVNNQTEIAAGKGPLCNAVCWRNSINDPDWPGQCFGGTIQNTTNGELPIANEIICDSAAWINQP